MGLGHWLDQAFDHVNDLVEKKALPDVVINPLTSAAGAAIDFVGGVTKDAALDTLDALKWDRDHLISQPLSAGELLLNPNSKIYTDAGQTNPWTAHPTPSIFKAAWREARHISPVQASMANYGSLSSMGPSPVRNAGQKILGPVAAPGFDITNPDQRKAAFDSWTNAGKYTTGIGDAALSFYVGPGVPEGKALMALRRKGLIKPLAKGAVDSAKVERITTAAPGLAEDAGLLAKAKEKLITPFDAQRRVTKMTDDLANMTQAQRADYLARNTSMRSAPGLISLMARAPDSDAMRMVLRYAMDPNPQTAAQLQNKWAQGRDEVNRLRYTKIPELEKALADLPTRMGSYLGDGGTKLGQMAIDDARASLDAAKLTKDYYRDVLTVRGTLKNVPRTNVRQSLTRSLADSALHLDWDVLQPSRYGVATRILKSAGEKRAGVIDVNRTNHATEQIRLAADRVGHGTSVVVDRFGNRSGGGLSKEVKDGLVLAMSNAERIGPTAVMDVVQNFEEIALVHYGKISRVEGQTDADIVVNARRLLEATGTRRAAVRAKFGMISRDATYTGAPRLDAAGNPTGHLLDEVQDGLGIWTHNPMVETEFADRIPILDIDRMAKVMNRHRLAMMGENRTQFLAALRGDGGAIANANAIVTEALEGFNRYWKPAQLARLGWPIRVITDENLRIYSVLGAMNMLPLQIQSVAHGLGQTRPAYKARDILASKQVLAAKHAIAQLHDVRLAGRAREGLVADLEDLNAHISALDTAIPKLGEKLVAQNDALQGTEVHKITATRGQLRHGPAGITMKFGSGLGGRAVGETTHTRIGLSEHDPEVYHTTAAETDPGLATLRDMVGDEGFTEMTTMSVPRLRQRAIGVGLNPKVADKLTDPRKLMSLIGKQMAREAGHKAIVHAPEGLEGTYTALHPDALRSADRTGFNQTAHTLDKLTDAHDTLTAAARTLTGRIAEQPAWTLDQENNWGELVNAALKPSAKVKVLGKPAKFSGEIKMHLPSGATVMAPDAGHGQAGRISLDLSSASGTMRDLAGLDRKQINKLRLEVGDPVTILPTTDETGMAATLHQLSYDRAYEKAVNNQIANSMIGRMILEGHSDDEIAIALRRTTKGQDLVAMNPVRGSDPHQWVEDVRQHVNHYLPTDELKYAASKGLVTSQMLKDTFPVAAMRPVIHGESLEMATGRNAMTSFMERRIEGLYQKLGTTPTDALSRHPFFTEHYRQELQRQITRNVAPEATHVEPEHLEQMMRASREHALAQVKSVLYDTANQTHLGHALRFVSPFFNAWAEALTVWGKLWMEDPSRIARLVQVWNAPSKMHATYIDSYGQEQVALPLPKGVAKAMGASSIAMPKNTVEQLIFQGQYWWMPGAGVPVTVPLGEIVRQRPDMADSVKPFLPYGTGANPLMDIVPSTVKKAFTLARKEDDPAYVADWVQQVQQLATDRQLGRNHLGDAELIAEAHHRASSFAAFKFLTSLVAPAQVTVRPEYQMFYDQLKTLQTQYRAYPNGKDEAGRDAGQAFLAANGDDFHYLVGSTTHSNIGGIASTEEGYRASKKYAKQIQANPQWGKFFVGNEDQGAYSQAVQLYQKQTRIGGGNMDRQRGGVQPADVIKDSQIEQGWDEFRRVDTLVDSALKERGLKSINVAAAADIKAAKEKLVADIEARNPAWAVAKDTFTTGKTDRFVDMVNDLFAKRDPNFMNRPGFTTLGRYLASRGTLVAALAERKAAGGSDNLQADQNTDLRNAWATIVGNLRLQDTAFADLQTRWLQGDRLESGGKS